VVLDKDGEDHLDWSHEKRKITESQGGHEYPTYMYNKKKDG